MTDVAIRVNTKGYNAASFNDVAIDTLIRRGEDEAMKHWDELTALKKLSVSTALSFLANRTQSRNGFARIRLL